MDAAITLLLMGLCSFEGILCAVTTIRENIISKQLEQNGTVEDKITFGNTSALTKEDIEMIPKDAPAPLGDTLGGDDPLEQPLLFSAAPVSPRGCKSSVSGTDSFKRHESCDYESLDRPLLGAAAEVSPSEGLRRKALLKKLSERVIDPCDGDTMTSPRGFKRHELCPEKGRRFNVEAPTTPTTRMRPSLSTVKGAKKKSDADFDLF